MAGARNPPCRFRRPSEGSDSGRTNVDGGAGAWSGRGPWGGMVAGASWGTMALCWEQPAASAAWALPRLRHGSSSPVHSSPAEVKFEMQGVT